MKFGKQIELHAVPGWEEQYVPYKRLKRIIKRIHFALNRQAEAEQARQKSASENDPLLKEGDFSGLSEAERTTQEFWDLVDETIDKVNKFYMEQMGLITTRVTALDLAVHETTRDSRHVHTRPSLRPRHQSVDFDRGFAGIQDLFDMLKDMEQYVQLNYQGLRKIVKKYDKALGSSEMVPFLEKLQDQHFYKSNDFDFCRHILFQIVSKDKLEQGHLERKLQKERTKDKLFKGVRTRALVLSFAIFISILVMPIFPKERQIEQNCLALCGLVITMWITTALPYFATALCIPPLVVLLQVMKDPSNPHKPMSAVSAAEMLLSEMFNHTSVLILGGYAISASFAKCQIELMIAGFLQQKFGQSPKLFLLAFMYTGLFLSMWISNHTAPVLCISVILPIIRDFPKDSPFVKCVLLGLAFACNFGGMMTPIASLQNALAVSYLEKAGYTVSFGQWMMIAVPMCSLGVLLCWAFLILALDPSDVSSIPIIIYEDNSGNSKKRNLVIILSLLTLGLWATFNVTRMTFGDLGIIALMYMGFMFGTGILSQMDFNSFSWHLLFLLGGGNVLGKAIKSSGLLATVSSTIVEKLPVENPMLVTMYLLIIVISLTTFVSHTVGAIILLPIVVKLASDIGDPILPVVLAAFAISAAMALPFSSFPNVNSLLVEDDNGRPYLNVKDFFRVGVPFSILTLGVIATVGYGLASLIITAEPA